MTKKGVDGTDRDRFSRFLYYNVTTYYFNLQLFGWLISTILYQNLQFHIYKGYTEKFLYLLVQIQMQKKFYSCNASEKCNCNPISSTSSKNETFAQKVGVFANWTFNLSCRVKQNINIRVFCGPVSQKQCNHSSSKRAWWWIWQRNYIPVSGYLKIKMSGLVVVMFP